MILLMLVVCTVTSPVPSITWRRLDGIPFSRKVDVGKASGVLEIPYFQAEDAGLYECVAENTRGRIFVRGKLSFYCELVVFRELDVECLSLKSATAL